jgi:hypothetical protein
MPTYPIIVDGKTVDTVKSVNPIPSSALNDYAANNFHVKKLLGKRNIIEVKHGDNTNPDGSRTITVVAAAPATAPTAVAPGAPVNPLIAAAQAKAAAAAQSKGPAPAKTLEELAAQSKPKV